jgi:hypothetical protein
MSTRPTSATNTRSQIANTGTRPKSAGQNPKSPPVSRRVWGNTGTNPLPPPRDQPAPPRDQPAPPPTQSSWAAKRTNTQSAPSQGAKIPNRPQSAPPTLAEVRSAAASKGRRLAVEVAQKKRKAAEVAQTKRKAAEVAQVETERKAAEVAQTKRKAAEVAQVETERKAAEVAQTKRKAAEATRLEQAAITKAFNQELSSWGTNTVTRAQRFKDTMSGNALLKQETAALEAARLELEQEATRIAAEKEAYKAAKNKAYIARFKKIEQNQAARQEQAARRLAQVQTERNGMAKTKARNAIASETARSTPSEPKTKARNAKATEAARIANKKQEETKAARLETEREAARIANITQAETNKAATKATEAANKKQEETKATRLETEREAARLGETERKATEAANSIRAFRRMTQQQIDAAREAAARLPAIKAAASLPARMTQQQIEAVRKAAAAAAAARLAANNKATRLEQAAAKKRLMNKTSKSTESAIPLRHKAIQQQFLKYHNEQNAFMSGLLIIMNTHNLSINDVYRIAQAGRHQQQFMTEFKKRRPKI